MTNFDDVVFIPDQGSRKRLSERLNLPYNEDMQDWEWEVSDYNRIEDFIAEYSKPETSDSEKGSLIEIMIDCLNDLLEEDLIAEFENYSKPVFQMMRLRKDLHQGTINYWTRGDYFIISEYIHRMK